MGGSTAAPWELFTRAGRLSQGASNQLAPHFQTAKILPARFGGLGAFYDGAGPAPILDLLRFDAALFQTGLLIFAFIFCSSPFYYIAPTLILLPIDSRIIRTTSAEV
jgi:hypothetical protein